MKRFIQTVGLSVFVLWLWHGGMGFAAEHRIALVIGNSAYKIAPPLPNPANDARLMAETLRGLGFDVIERIDADRDTILLATFELQDRLIAAGSDAVGLFFYAGHGVQVGGENYLIPLGVDIRQEREVPVETVSASFALKQMEFAGND
ncbi:MAG: caspase family protein, partial [Proteobacteria bacterium]|nr:caspase family protein [Pseudomonadota bacterium]